MFAGNSYAGSKWLTLISPTHTPKSLETWALETGKAKASKLKIQSIDGTLRGKNFINQKSFEQINAKTIQK